MDLCVLRHIHWTNKIRDQIYNWAVSWQNQQSGCAPNEGSDQPGQIVFAVRMTKAWVLSYQLSAQRRLGSDWADAQADPPSLIRVFAGRKCYFVCFVTRRLISWMWVWLSLWLIVLFGTYDNIIIKPKSEHDGWVRVLRPFNSISVISRRWKDEHERLCAMKRRLGSGRISPPAGFEPATPWSEVGSANRSATRTLHKSEQMKLDKSGINKQNCYEILDCISCPCKLHI